MRWPWHLAVTRCGPVVPNQCFNQRTGGIKGYLSKVFHRPRRLILIFKCRDGSLNSKILAVVRRSVAVAIRGKDGDQGTPRYTYLLGQRMWPDICDHPSR